jgi:uncharacterized iron-regulated protein
MFLLPCAIVAVAQQPALDPMRLPIGRKGEITVPLGQIVEAKSGKVVTVDDVAKAADRKRFVFLGENHATAPHQQLEADVIAALVKRGRDVVVGLEMYTRPKQEWLDQWSQGTLEEADFLERSEWKKQWGFDFAFYRPVFDVVKANKLPLVALNVPRDWVRAVGKGGYANLTAEQRQELPADMHLGNEDHKKIYNALTGGHPMGTNSIENMYAAQVLWDEGMADTAIKWLDSHPVTGKTVFVVLAGSGHVMYGQGINYRIARRKKGSGITLVMSQSEQAPTVAKGVGDFVYVTRAESE